MKTNQFPRIMPTDAMKEQAKKGYEVQALTRAQEHQRTADERQDLLNEALELGVGIVHIYDPENPKGGITVAFRKCSPYKSGRMVEVAVNTCSPEDNFSKKLGVTGALTKFFEGETIVLPLLQGYEDEEVNQTVKLAFSTLYFSVN